MPRQPRKPDPLSPPYQSETIQQAIAGFEAALELASEKFAADPHTGKIGAIEAVHLFLRDGRVPQRWIAPFLAIRDDIIDGNRKSAELRLRDWLVRAKIGAALDVLINQGRNEEAAAREVAKIVAKHRGVVRGADDNPIEPTWRRISEMRTRLLRRKGEAKPNAKTKAVIFFDRYRQIWLEHEPDVLKLLDLILAGQT